MINDRQVQIETDQLLALLKNPNLSKETLKRAHQLAFPEPDAAEWQGFLSGLFYSLGGALLLCGLLFFVDYHWESLDYTQRCLLFGLSTLLCAAVAWRKGRHSTAGKVAMTCGSLLLGALLIVASRVYETGEWHIILTAWSALILPWCVAAEFAPLWLFATGLFNVTLSVACERLADPPFFHNHYYEIVVFALNGGLLAAWEIGFRQGRTWMGRRWFPPILILLGLGPMTLSTARLLADLEVGLSDLFPLVPAIVAIWTGLLFYYSKVRRDVSVLSITLGSAVCLGTSLLWRFVLGSNDPISLLIVAGGLVTQISLALGVLRTLAPSLPADPKAPPQETPDVKLWLGQLATEGFIRPQQIEDLELSMRVQNELALPWFVRAMAGVGSFIAAVFLLLYLLSTGAITEENGVMFGLGLCALACFVAGVIKSELVNQACFSFCLCGQLTVWLVHSYNHGNPPATALLMAALELVLVVAYPGVFARFLSVNLAGLFFVRWLILVAPPVCLDIYVLAVASLVAFLWFWQHQIVSGSIGLAKMHAPVAMGSVTLLFTLLLSTITQSVTQPEVGWVASLGLVALVVISARQMGAWPKTQLGLAAVGMIGLSAPGVMAAVLVLMLAFYRRNHTLKGLAIVFLLAFGSAYYYHLALSLLVKSVVLMLSGCAFLFTAKSVDATPNPS